MNIESMIKMEMVSKGSTLLNENQDFLIEKVSQMRSMQGKTRETILSEMKASIQTDPYGFILFFEKNRQNLE